MHRTCQPPRHRPLQPAAYMTGTTELMDDSPRLTLGERLTDELLRTRAGTDAAANAAERLRKHCWGDAHGRPGLVEPARQ